jgi:hypothetical protein
MKLAAAAPLIATILACSAPKGEHDTVPPGVRRRIAQAVWPENLFDAAGQPERGFVRRALQPAYSELRIRRVAAPASLPGVTLFIGEARNADCVHCRAVTYAVAQHDSTFVSLLNPDDVQYLAVWAKPAILRDSTALRSFVQASLEATCLIGCDLKQVRRREDVPDADSPFLRAVDDSRDWKMPRTYSWQQNGGVLVEFVLYSAGRGVYAAKAESESEGRIAVAISPVAWYVMF